MRWLLWGATALVVALAAVGAVVATGTWLQADRGGTAVVLRDLDGRAVELDDPLVDSATRQTDGRFEAPRQGLDVPLVELTVTGNDLAPPTFTDAFVVRDTTADADDGTRPLVVAMHALRDGRAPGNTFFEADSADPEVTVSAGDLLVVDGVEYTVTRTEVLTKAAAARSEDVWSAQADGASRLVVITCLQRAGTSGSAAENLLVHAVRA
jgi:hypothetical protein